MLEKNLKLQQNEQGPNLYVVQIYDCCKFFLRNVLMANFNKGPDIYPHSKTNNEKPK